MVSGEESLRITADLSMRCFGCCEPKRPSGTCLPITGSGAAFISGSSVGAENDILAYAVSAGMEPVIPPKKNSKEQRDYDKYLYKLLPGPETLERHCHSLCQNLRCLYRCGTRPLYRYLGCYSHLTRVDTV